MTTARIKLMVYLMLVVLGVLVMTLGSFAAYLVALTTAGGFIIGVGLFLLVLDFFLGD